MIAETTAVRPGFIAKTLALLSLATFWLLPVSPFVAICAVVQTKGSAGWPRKFSVAAAVLCSLFTVSVAVMFFCVTIYILTGGLDQPPSAALFRY